MVERRRRLYRPRPRARGSDERWDERDGEDDDNEEEEGGNPQLGIGNGGG